MISGKPAVEASVGLLASASGGLSGPMQTGTRSLMLVFPSVHHPGGEVKIGAVIDVLDGPALIPGADEVRVVIRFWADEAEVYAVPGASFRLWYGRVVGAGVVTRIADEAAGA